MKKAIGTIKGKNKYKFKRCGAITCINNVQGLCNCEKCELYENVLIQED